MTASAGGGDPTFPPGAKAAAALLRLICERHRLPRDCARMEDASQLVFSAGSDHVVKIFAPGDGDFHATETVFLDRLAGRLPVRTPDLVASDCCDGYPYIVMERLPGATLARVWDSLSDEERRATVAHLGEMVRALHELPRGLFDDAPFRWRPFVEHQREALVEIHRRFGLADSWIAQLPSYLAENSFDFCEEGRMVPLHTELMPEHVLVERRGAGWSLSGLIDFEPSMVGHAEYEFCAVGLFLTPGRRDLFRPFLSAYGYGDASLESGLGRRIMVLMLLHRYGNLNRFLGRLPEPASWTTLGQLQGFWYGL